MQCNIDQRGRKARLVTGAVVDCCGTALLVVGFLFHQSAAIVAGVVCCMAGVFMIFEGVKGWCVVRAMGFKTKL